MAEIINFEEARRKLIAGEKVTIKNKEPYNANCSGCDFREFFSFLSVESMRLLAKIPEKS